MSLESRRLRTNLVVGALMIGLLGYALASRQCGKGAPGSSGDDDDAGLADPASIDTTVAAGPSEPGAAHLRDAGGPILDREKADRMRAAILQALAAPAPLPPNGAIPSEPPTHHLDEHPSMPSFSDSDGGALRDYIKSVIHDDYFPLAKQCYEASLSKNPKLGGRISMSFEIVGDKKIGGVVDNAAYDDEETTIIDPELRTCLRESMMSVSFDAPPKDGKVTVKYPITFAPDGPPDD